jgi:hypothetical protein
MKFNFPLRQYALAVYYGADKRFDRMLPTAIRVARARFRHGIGPVPFSVFRFSQVPESRWDNYIVRKMDSDAVLGPVNSDEMHRLARNKVLFYEHCRSAGLPTIPIICRVGGTPDPLGDIVENVVDPDRFRTLLESAPPQLFAKSIAGSFGEDAFLISRQGTEFAFAGRTGSAKDVFAYIAKQCNAQVGFIIQAQMRPHAEMLSLGSASGLPTVRVVTAMYADGPKVLFACLKIPVGTNITDNFAHGKGGNLLAGINLDSGELTPAYGSRSREWPVMMEVAVHPDSGYQVAGSRLPLWREVAEIALLGQRSLPNFTTIGWDVAATSEGLMLVEANSKYSMDVLQVAHQRGLKAELAAKLNGTIN